MSTYCDIDLPHARPYSEDSLSRWLPLNDPVWTDTYGHLRDEDPVLGLYVDSEARALPWWIMKSHHVANIDTPFPANRLPRRSGPACI